MSALLTFASVAAIGFACYMTGRHRGRDQGWLERYYQELDADTARRAAIRRNNDGTFAEKGLTK